MITLNLELDSEGNPKCGPALTDEAGNGITAEQIPRSAVRFEIHQGQSGAVFECPPEAGGILARMVCEWAEIRLAHVYDKIHLIFEEDREHRTSGIRFTSSEQSAEGFREFTDEAEITASQLGFLVGRGEAPEVIRLLKARIKETRKRPIP